MTATTPCYRHPRWLVACRDCTAFHLAVAIAHRDEAVSADERIQEATDVARAALRLVA
jgi:hypothetical protein